MRQLADEELIPLVKARRGEPALYKDIHGLDTIPADARALFLSDVHISHLDEVFGKKLAREKIWRWFVAAGYTDAKQVADKIIFGTFKPMYKMEIEALYARGRDA